MEEYAVDVLPGQVLQWVREDARRKPPRLWVRASKHFEADAEDAARSGEDDVSLVTATGTLEISPQRGRRGWTLQVSAIGTAELRPSAEGEDAEDAEDLTIDAFESQFLVPEHGEVEITVLAENPESWRRFQRWLGRRRLRSPGPVTRRAHRARARTGSVRA